MFFTLIEFPLLLLLLVAAVAVVPVATKVLLLLLKDRPGSLFQPGPGL